MSQPRAVIADGRSTDGEDAPSESKLERVYAEVRQRIIDGRFAPGERLVLDRIARELDVSAVPVREALRRLEAEGYVEFERNVGARVSRLDRGEYVPTMHILALLEGYATATAAPFLTDDSIEEARALNRELAVMADGGFDPLRFSAFNRRFHFVIYRHCPHEHLRQLIETEWDRLDSIRRSGFVFAPQRAHASVAEHEGMLRLVGRGASAEEIELAARLHKLHTVEAVLAGMESEGASQSSSH